MPRIRATSVLQVYMNGQLVGRLTRHASSAIDFQYEPVWLQGRLTIPVSLSLPLREDRYVGKPVVAVFENLLPDQVQIRQRLAASVGAEGPDAFSLLSVIGRDCVGALQFLPEGESPGEVGEVRGTPLRRDDIATILGQLSETPLGISLIEGQEFRISLAGVQEKTALLFHKGRWFRPEGNTATTHILKPPIGRGGNALDLSQSVENEFFCLAFTSGLGLPTANAKIEKIAGQSVLIVERFDRLWTKDERLLRLPQEDCCQALGVPSARKYEADGGPGIRQILELLQGSDDPQTDRRLFFKSQLVFWLLGATDGHAKNFSVRLLPGGRFRLAPLYDIMSAQPLLDSHQLVRRQMKLSMSVGSNKHYVIDSILTCHFFQTATEAGMGEKEVQSIIDELHEATPTVLNSVLDATSEIVPQTVSGPIAQGIRYRLNGINRPKA